MAKVTIEYKRAASNITAIIIHYRCHDGKLKYYTGESSEPGKLTKKADMMVKFIQATAADHRIASIDLSTDMLREKLDLEFRPKKATGLIKRMEAVIDKMKSGEILTPAKKKYAAGSIKAFRHTVRLLSSFRPGISGVTLKTYNEFITWCHGIKYSTNYIGSQIKNWKTLGKAAGTNPIYSDKGFKKIQEETFDIYLDEKELKKLQDHKCTDREALARDWFILDCYTGLRVSDLTLLTKQNLKSGFITIANEKTGAKVVIPVHPQVKKILTKYKGFPPKISDIEINRMIKVVARKAGIKDRVLYTITKGGKREDEYLEKWQMISTHTARRSFITNLLKRGVNETLVMKLTGIKSHMTLQRYNKLSSEEAAMIMKNNSFFK